MLHLVLFVEFKDNEKLERNLTFGKTKPVFGLKETEYMSKTIEI